MTEAGAIMTSNLWAACRRTAKIAALTVLLIAISIASYCGIIRLLGNIHVVEDGKLYRSAQLDKAQFEQVINEYGIKSILNLRGDSPGEPWYDDEIAVSKTLGVKHFDYGIWASGIVTPKQIGEILKIVRDAPKPLLIHCQGGADRSGLVAALYVAEVEGKSADEADEQLSLFYGHFPYLTSKTDAMDKSFWAYVKAHPSPRQLRPPPQLTKAAVPPG
jgi:protein tyrosine/serine phosphatase